MYIDGGQNICIRHKIASPNTGSKKTRTMPRGQIMNTVGTAQCRIIRMYYVCMGTYRGEERCIQGISGET